MSDNLSGLDANQIIRRAGVNLSDPTQPTPAAGLAVLSVGGTLVPEKYDQIDLTYVVAGNGIGEIATATYFLAAVQVALLNLSYDASNRISSVVRS